MTKPKVSVIMPVFNTEQYVNEALMSIINQTLKEIEIIVINDGSTDGSLEVISRIAENDNRVQIYSQENQGQSVARNLGISIAKGEYIYFMDSDDLLDLDALECCYNKCEAESLDFVFFDADIICENKEISFSIDYHRTEIEEKVYYGAELLNELINKYLYRVAPWMNFIRLSYLHKIRLNFYPGIIHEDELFSAILYIEAERVGRINKNYFKRRVRGNSTMTKQFSWKNIEGYFTVIEQLREYIERKTEYEKAIICRYIKIMLNVIIRNAYVLSAKERYLIFLHCIKFRYIRHLRIKTIFILLFKSHNTTI
ncbi:glycosyltransferase [Bacteroides luti]|nr:glycosyltransferase [Bacteroides luti]